jgi:hypothetical protein
MVVTVRYDATGDTDTFLLGRPRGRIRRHGGLFHRIPVGRRHRRRSSR